MKKTNIRMFPLPE